MEAQSSLWYLMWAHGEVFRGQKEEELEKDSTTEIAPTKTSPSLDSQMVHFNSSLFSISQIYSDIFLVQPPTKRNNLLFFCLSVFWISSSMS